MGDGLSLAAAGGGLVFGHDAVEAAARSGAIVGLLTASDASERTVASVRSETIPTWALPLDREALGRRVGQGTLAVIGVRDVACTVHLRRQLRRWTRLG
jgi:ribosomal protein L7Ae-like RNA K-turn-binding protein